MHVLDTKTIECIAYAISYTPWGTRRDIEDIARFFQSIGCSAQGIDDFLHKLYPFDHARGVADLLQVYQSEEASSPQTGPGDISPAIEKVLLRLVTPLEYGGDYVAAHSVAKELNDPLVVEHVKLVFDDETLTYSVAVLKDDAWRAEVAARALPNETPAPANNDAHAPDGASPPGNRVFVVHGHDENAKLEIENLLLRLNLEPVVLHREPNKGRTLIQKFEDNSDVAYAIILLTPDDMGRSQDELEEKAKPRARQNVVFEMGYFFAKLRLDHVLCLYKEGVELPSDVDGIAYVPFSNSVKGAAAKIVQELKAVGMPVGDWPV